jgi:uncharacterized membrane protein YbhN (UPF0104 family)
MTARQTLALKLLASFLLLLALAFVADLRHMPQRLFSLDPWGVALAMLAVVMAVAVSVVKWGLILALRDHRLPPQRLLRHYLVGLFFNNLMPGTVGGDAVRAWATSRDTREVFALTMLPLSLSGFGVREAAYVYFFALVGVAPADAVAASLSFFVLVAVVSLPGAPLFLLSRQRREEVANAKVGVAQ